LSPHSLESHGFLRRKNKVSANRQFPILDWVFDYQKDWLQWDLIAGLIATATHQGQQAFRTPVPMKWC
jgi:hypothetical protein